MDHEPRVVARERDVGEVQVVDGASRRTRSIDAAEVVRAEADPEAAGVDLAQHVERLLAAAADRTAAGALPTTVVEPSRTTAPPRVDGRWRRTEAGRIRAGARTRETVVDAGTVGPWSST